jgi:F-type H+-transporting ATPase subunit alpha
MTTLVQEIEARLAGAKAETAWQSVGFIREIGDGVARVEGLHDVMLNEMLDLGQGVTGIALSLEESDVGVIILGDYTKLLEGAEVHGTGRLLQVPVGKGLLGRVVNTLGEPLDGKGPIASDTAYPVEKLAPGIMRRRPISQPVQTGIMAIDAMIPIGRGQRELVIGDRSTGKTTICVDTIISQARQCRRRSGSDHCSGRCACIYVAIGQKRSTIAQIISRSGRLRRDAVRSCSPRRADSAASQCWRRCRRRHGEWFMDNGMDALIVYDDLSKHAVAYRQVSLVMKLAVGPRAYPATCSIFTAVCSSAPARVGRSTATDR